MASNKKGLFSRMKSTLSGVAQRISADQFEAHLDQLIHQTQESIREQEQAIAAAHADQLVARARIDELQPKIEDLEQQAILAIRGRRPSRARELSSQLEPLLAELRVHQVNAELACQQISQRKLLIETHEGQIRRFRNQLGLRRASENLQRSQEAIHRFGQASSAGSSCQDQPDVSPTETAQQIFQRLSEQAKSPSRKTQARPAGKSARKATKKAVKKTKKSPSNSRSTQVKE